MRIPATLMDNTRHIHNRGLVALLVGDWLGTTLPLRTDPHCPLPPSQRLASVRIYNAIADQRPEWVASSDCTLTPGCWLGDGHVGHCD